MEQCKSIMWSGDDYSVETLRRHCWLSSIVPDKSAYKSKKGIHSWAPEGCDKGSPQTIAETQL